MVAYSFKPRFCEPILAGTKTQTIRAHRKRHARVGEELQLFTGMRTKRCLLIKRARCVGLFVVALNLPGEDVEIKTGLGAPGPFLRHFHGEQRLTPSGGIRRSRLDEFARRDGFGDWRDLRAFWAMEHPGVDRFEGVLIRWAP